MNEIVSPNEIQHAICLLWCNDRHSCQRFNYRDIEKLDDHTVIFDLIYIRGLETCMTIIYNISTKSNFSLSICSKNKLDDFNLAYSKYKLLVEFEEMLNYNFNNIICNAYCIYIGNQIIICPGSYVDNNLINYYNIDNPGLTLTFEGISEFINLPILQKYRIYHSKTVNIYE
jgi:hypothetical protein